MRLSAAARLRVLVIASLVGMLAAVGFLVIDRDGSTVQAASMSFSPATVPAVTLEVGEKLSYTVPTLSKAGCYAQGTVTLAPAAGRNGFRIKNHNAFQFNKDRFTIVGTAAAVATVKTYTVTVPCTGPHGTGSASYSINITVNARTPKPMAFSSANLGTIKLVKGQELLAGNDKVNNPIGQAVAGDTVGTVTYSINPTTLPAGLSFSTTTGKITGTPTAVFASSQFTVTATDATPDTPQTVTYTVDIEVVEPFAFPDAVVSHTLYKDDVRPTIPIAAVEHARGTITYESPDPYGGTTASLVDLGLVYAGVPTGFEHDRHGTEPHGVHQFTMTAKETYRGHVRQTATVRFVFTMKPPKVLRYLKTDLGLQILNHGANVNITPPTQEHAVGTVTYAILPALPSPMTFDTATGAFGGTAPLTSHKKTRYTVTATDANSRTASYSFDLLVKHASTMSFVPSSLGTIDVEVNEQAWDAFLPHTPLLVNVVAGCSPVPILEERVNSQWINAGDPGTTGTIRMVPSPTDTPPENYGRYYIEGELPASADGETKHYRFELRCYHAGGTESVVYTFALRGIPQKMKFKPNDLGSKVLYKGVEYTIQPPPLVAASGNVSYAVKGRVLPTGLSVDSNTGVISGTPTVPDQSRTFTIEATDSSDPQQTATFTIRLSVSNAMTFASASLPDQTLTVDTQMTALNPPTLSNNVSVVRYTVSPNIPAGLAVSNLTGVISGTPTGTSVPTTYTITATDSTSPTPQTDSFTVNIKVNPATAMAFSGTQSDVVLAAGKAASITAKALTNAVGTLTYSISPALPSGLSISSKSGAITGTPTAASAGRSYTITATDSNSQSASYSFNITVVKPTVSFSAATSSPNENAGTHNVAVSLSPAPAAATTVNYTISGTATAGSDYSRLSGSVSVASGATTVNIPVTITDDSVDDDDETIILTLSAGGNYYRVGSTSVHTATITDNDDPPADPVLTITGGSAVTEGTAASFTVNASPNVSGTVTLSYTVAQTGDFVAAGDIGTKSVSFTGGTGTITVATVGDSTDEANGSVTVTLKAGSGYTLSSTKTATVNVSDDDVPELTITAGSAVTEGTAASFTINASPSASGSITVNYTVTQSGAFLSSSNVGTKTVSLTGGSQTFTIATVGDSTDEANGSVTVTLKAGTGYTLGSTTSATVIVNDDDVPELTITAGSAVTEGTDASFTVSASPSASGSITVNYAVTQSGAFVASSNRGTKTVSLNGGNANITVPTVGDSTDEANGSVTVTLDAGTGYTLGNPKTATVTVNDDDDPPPVTPTVTFDSASSTAAEDAGTHNVALTLSASQSGSVAVSYTVTGTATSASDYTALGTTVSFSAGSTTVNIPVVITDDSSDEANETVIITLTEGTAYDLGTTTVYTLTITDNDDPPPATPVVSITAGSAVNEGTDASFTLSASPTPGSAVTLNYTVTQSGSFVDSGDLSTQSVSLSGGSGSITVPTDNDSLDEANGSVTVTLNSGTGYSVHNSNGAATVTVTDDDVTEASFATATSSAAEGSGTNTVRVNLSPVPATALTLKYTVSGTATSGSDFTSIGTSVSVPSGSSTVDISVPIRDDSADEVDETVIITLAAGSHYTVGTANAHTLTITDNDVPAVSFSASASSIAEGGGTKNITVDISPAPATGFTLTYAVSGTATSGSDYTAPGGTVGVAQGQTRVTIPVAVTDDSVANEASETVILTLSNGSGYDLGSRSVHTLSINDNDGTPTVSFNSSSATIMEGPNKRQSVRINLSPAPSSNITLRYTIGGTATAGSDYNTLSGSKTVAGGSTSTTITINIIDDSIEDTGETLILTLSSGTGYTVGSPSTFTLTITNDDGPGTGSTPARAQRKAYIPSDPPNFCRGAVSEVADPPQQPFPTLGREVAPQRPCRGSGTLTLHDLADTLDDDQTKLERGFYITAQLHSTSDYRSRFRGGSGSKLYVVDSNTEARYQLLGGARRMIELSLWLIVKNPIQDSNTVARLGREAGLSEEFSICLPYEPTKRQPVADIARWDPASLSWDILEHTLTESDDQVCALTDQVSSFVLVTPEAKPSTGAGIPQPGDPQ